MRKQSGQIGLVVLLLMTALLTLGVGAVTQSTSDLRDTRQETDASLAFNQAEAGVEEALARLEESSGDVFDFVNDPSRTEYTSAPIINTETGTETVYTIVKENTISDVLAKENETVEVNLAGATIGPNLRVEWDEPTTALEVMFFIENAGVVSVQRHALAHTPDSDRFPGFENAGGNYVFDISTISSTLRSVRIRPIGGDTLLTVNSEGWTLPVQSYRIISTASQQNSNEVKVIELSKSIESLPAIFDFALFSGETITM